MARGGIALHWPHRGRARDETRRVKVLLGLINRQSIAAHQEQGGGVVPKKPAIATCPYCHRQVKVTKGWRICRHGLADYGYGSNRLSINKCRGTGRLMPR